MTNEALQVCEQEFRRAVAERRHSDVPRLASVYCEAAVAHLAILPPADPRIAVVGSHVEATLSWAHVMLITARAAIAGPLAFLPLVSRYLAIPELPAGTRLEA